MNGDSDNLEKTIALLRAERDEVDRQNRALLARNNDLTAAITDCICTLGFCPTEQTNLWELRDRLKRKLNL
jgi:hypothetical protein